MDVYLMTFNKRENSTERPTLSGATSGTLRDNCSVMFPSIGFSWGQENTPIAANYAYIPEFSRYYFIKNWTWDSGIWWADMAVDVLASWKTEIGNSTQYVLRSAAYSNGDIIDDYYPITDRHTFQYELIVNTWTGRSPAQGWYVVGIINSDTNAVGTTSYYVFTPTQMRLFMAAMLSATSWTGVDFTLGEISEAFYKSLFNPFQYVVSAMWVPEEPPHSQFPIGVIPFGWWTLTADAYILTNSYIAVNNTVTVPKHPQASIRGDYLNCAPFTRLKLMYEPFGCLELDATLFAKVNTCYISVLIDAITGVGRLSIGAGDSVDLDFIATAQVGVPVQLAQVSQDILGAATDILGAVGGAVSGVSSKNYFGAASSVITGIASAAQSMVPRVSTKGMNGAYACFTQAAFLAADCYAVADNDVTHHGRPICAMYQLSQMSGYQLILNPDIKINGTSDENTLIKNYLSTGYYYE